MNVEQLAYELRNLDALGRERVFDRLTEIEAEDFFEAACPQVFDKCDRLNIQVEDLRAELVGRDITIRNLEDERDSLRERLAAIKEATNA